MSATPALRRIFQDLIAAMPEPARLQAMSRFEQLCQTPHVRLDLLEKVLESERDRTYFADGHFKATLPQKGEFNWETADWTCRVLAAAFPPPAYDYKGLFGPRRDDCVQVCTDCLHERGFCVMPIGIPPTELQAIVDRLGDIAFRVKATGEILDGYRRNNIYRAKGNTVWVRDQQDILRIPQVQQLAMDPTVLTIVRNYLKCAPIHVQSNCWWTINYQTSDQSLSSDAQLFHQDKEFIRFVKVFVYLNDVDDSNGPHQYVAGSARDYQQHVPENYAISQRLSDEYLRDQYAADRFVRIKGPAGTIVLEDTSGFHKGEPVLRGHRLMLQLEYACSLYFNPVPSFSWDGTTAAFREFGRRHPRWALNYDEGRYEAHRSRLPPPVFAPPPKFRERVRSMFASLLDTSGRRRSA